MAVEANIERRMTLVSRIRVNDTVAVNLEATISSDPEQEPNFSKAIINSNLYYSNLQDIRVKVDEFTKAVRDTEDELVGTPEPTEPEPDPDPEQ